MTKQKNTGLFWCVGILMASLMLAAVLLFGDLRYTGNDDGGILRAFMGFGAAELPTFHMCLHWVLLYPLRWLSLAFPALPWFSYLQLAFLWYAAALSVKSLMGCFRNRGLSPWWGAASGAVYLLCFTAAYCCQVTYTVTACLLGAAAVLQILSIPMEDITPGRMLRAVTPALLAVVCAYGLRQLTALPLLAFCGLAFLYRVLDRGPRAALKRLKPVLAALGLVVFCFAVLVGGRMLEIRQKDMGEYLRWQQARVSVMDYSNVTELPDQVLEQVGWSRDEAALVNKWYFLDSNINADAFETIAAYNQAQQETGFLPRLQSAAAAVAALPQAQPLAWRSCFVLTAMLLICVMGLLMKRKGTLMQWLTLGLAVLLTAAALLYLGWKGRLPLRAALTAVLPLVALIFGLVPDCISPKPSAAGKLLLGAAVLLTAAACAFYVIPAVSTLQKPVIDENDESDLVNPFQDLDEYAASNPESLIFYDDTFATDTRMFPSTAYGTPTNLLFWGGWTARSPEYTAQLAAFGLDASNMDGSVFLREDVYLARGVLDSDPTALAAYLEEQSGSPVEYYLDSDWGGVHVGQFYPAE